MAYITNDMIQYSCEELTKVSDTSKFKTYPCGTTGIAIIIDHHPDYRYSLLFGDVITHRFKTIEAMREWNSNYNNLRLAINISIVLTHIEEGGI